MVNSQAVVLPLERTPAPYIFKTTYKLKIPISIFFQKGTPPKVIFVVCNFLFLACIPCRLLMYLKPENEDTYRIVEEALLVFAVPGK